MEDRKTNETRVEKTRRKRGKVSQIIYSLVVILGLNSVSGVQYKGMMIDR